MNRRMSMPAQETPSIVLEPLVESRNPGHPRDESFIFAKNRKEEGR
ncbi:hypothetical protein [Saccharibacillus sp. O23]|nr:hypothetical protein [Saccharibacillus sp. O23]